MSAINLKIVKLLVDYEKEKARARRQMIAEEWLAKYGENYNQDGD